MAKCTTRDYDYQPFPKTGHFVRNMNLRIDALREPLSREATVYCYIIATIENREGRFVQTGNGPNFQGDLVTLCSCKHFMRTFLSPDDWEGKWIAGFSGVRAGQGNNQLVYLMRVSQAFDSHRDFWSSEGISPEAKVSKVAHLYKYGDIFEPQGEIVDPFDPGHYIPPRSDHVHAHCWHGDVHYRGRSNRVAALLVGDPEQSFLWDRPLIHYASRLHRGQKKLNLETLFALLKED